MKEKSFKGSHWEKNRASAFTIIILIFVHKNSCTIYCPAEKLYTTEMKINNGPSAYDVNNNNKSRCAICFSLGDIEQQLNFVRYDCKVN